MDRRGAAPVLGLPGPWGLPDAWAWDNDLHPEPRALAARIARIERHLGLHRWGLKIDGVDDG
jgi:hypothetical protein